MQYYKWIGIDKDGNKKSGYLPAKSQDHLKNILIKQEIALIKAKTKIRIIKPSIEDHAIFLENLHELISCGIPIIQSLKLVHRSLPNFRKITETLIDSVEAGNTLSSAMDQSSSFSKVIVKAIRAGEQSGNLACFLKRASINLSTKASFNKELKKAALLPIITFSFSVAIVILLFTLVIPQFVPLFEAINKKLPATTRTLLSISTWLNNLPIYCIPGLITLPIAMWTLFRKNITTFFPEAPIIRSAIYIHEYHAFFQALELLLNSGITITNAIKAAKETVFVPKIKLEIEKLCLDVEQGQSIAESFKKHSHLRIDQISALIEIGERTGTLQLATERIEKLLEKKLKAKMQFFSTVLQPVLLLFLGCFIAVLVYALYIPLFDAALCFS